MRHLLAHSLAGRQRLGRVGQTVLERTEQKRQRRPELVTDVAEERCLGSIELGQSVGSLARRLMGLRLCDGSPDVTGDEVEERLVCRIQYAPRASPGLAQTRPPAGTGARTRGG